MLWIQPSHAQMTILRSNNEVIVKLKGGVGIQKFANAKPNGAPKFGQGGALGKYKVRESLNKLKIHRFELTAGQSVDEALTELGDDPDVEYAEPNYVFGKLEVDKSQTMTKSDLDAMVSAQGQSGSLAITLANIQTSEAWGVVHGSEKPIVAIIDSGADLNHDILSNALWTNPNEIYGNGIDDDHNGYIDDIHGWNFVNNTNNPADGDGHGTHVAGIVRGVSQDIFAWPLGSPSVQIMVLKFLDDTGSGSTANAISAIYYAVNNGAKILNNSWGGTTYSRALHEAIAYAYAHEVLFVAAAGNSKSNNDSSPMYPASYNVPNVLSVAATNDYDSLASFSNFGSGTVHIASPGVSILSSYPPNSYTYLSGTSMAAPVVAGVASLIAREKPAMNGYQMKQLIMNSGDVKSALSGKVSTSARVNVFKAVSSAQSASILSGQPPYQLQVSGQDRDLASNVAMGGGGCGAVEILRNGKGGGGLGGTDFMTKLFFVFVLALPLLILLAIRPKSKFTRRFERYYLHSTVEFNIGDQKVNGLISTISLGGMGINSPVPLAEGTVVKMVVQGPNGAEQIEVKGQVVWSTSEKKYGIAFTDVQAGVQSIIKRWTSSLVRSN